MFPRTVAHGNSGGFLSSSTTILLSESLKRDSSIEKSAERWEVGGQVGQDKEHSTSFSQGACQSTLCSKLYILSIYYYKNSNETCSLRTTDAPWSLFFIEIWNFWVWTDNLGRYILGIWGIFSQFISPHFGTVSPISMFSINQPLFL